jgi:hypothetical protein
MGMYELHCEVKTEDILVNLASKKFAFKIEFVVYCVPETSTYMFASTVSDFIRWAVVIIRWAKTSPMTFGVPMTAGKDSVGLTHLSSLRGQSALSWYPEGLGLRQVAKPWRGTQSCIEFLPWETGTQRPGHRHQRIHTSGLPWVLVGGVGSKTHCEGGTTLSSGQVVGCMAHTWGVAWN